MKILMILPQAYFEPKGTSLSTFHRLKVLSELGHKVDLLTYPLGQDVTLPNVSVYRIPNVFFAKQIKIGPSLLKFLFDLILIVYTLKMLSTRHYDLIHSHEEAAFFSTLFAALFSLKHIYDMHSSLPQQLLNFQFTKSKIIVKMFRLLEKLTITKATVIIAICEDLYNQVKTINPYANVYLVENFLQDLPFNNTKPPTLFDISKDYNLKDKRVVLYAGTFEKYQGLDLVIEGAQLVIDHHKDVHFLLVGGRPDQVNHYKKKVSDLSITPHFTFTGKVPPEYIQSVYNHSDILISPRYSGTNTPLKIYAYLRSGKPIVATRHITHTQVLNDKVAMLTDITPQSFARGILAIMEDPTLAIRLSKAAMQLADKKYTYTNYVRQMRSLLKILNTHSYA